MKMRVLSIVFLISLSFRVVASPEKVADTLSLNGTWKFKTDLYKNGVQQKWFDPSADKRAWDNMEVPGNWELHNEYANFAGDAWYSYTFTPKAEWLRKHIKLVFQSVYNDSEIWLNGEKLGENHLGFLQFDFDVSSRLHLGTVNHLVLKVNNVARRGAIWNWGGIRRPVWLEVTNPVRINHVAVTALPDLKTKKSHLDFKVEVANYSSKAQNISYSINVFHHSRRVHSSGIVKASSIKAADSITLSSSVSLSAANTRLWHFDRPELYSAQINIYDGDVLQHSYSTRFGIRKIEVSGLKLLLNGEEIRPVGFNLVPEDRVTGNTLPLDRIKSMVDMMKESGANMARLSHMPLPKEFLDYLDERGIMTFEEVSLWGKDILVDPKHPLPKLWLKKLIRQQYNHPSVIGWSVGNEIGSVANNPMADEYIRGAIAEAKRMDPNRLAMYVSNTVQSQPKDAAGYGDIIMLNSYGNWGIAAEKAHEYFPGKPIFFSEFGENLNNEDPAESKINFANMLSKMRGKPYVIGASLWTFNDYRSTYWSVRPSWITPPSQNRAWGVVNTILQPKKTYYQIRNEYLPFKLSFEDVAVAEQSVVANLAIKARSWSDFPAYNVRGYKISLQALDANNKNESFKFIDIPDLEPGNELKLPLRVKITPDTRAVSIKVLDGQSYSRFDTLIHLVKPEVPQVLSVHTSKNAVRVVYNKLNSASEYSLKYENDSLNKETPRTINGFIDVPNLKGASPFTFTLIAHNNAGSVSSAPSSFSLNEQELPPVIWGVRPVQKGFFISYTSDPLDYKYEVQYGEKSGVYVKHLTFDNRGVFSIPNLDDGTSYFFRLRRIMQWGFASDWTHEVRVDLRDKSW